MEILATAWAAAPEPLSDSPSPIIWRNVVLLLAAITAVVGVTIVRRWRRRPDW